MADLFCVKAPLVIRYPDGRRHVMVAWFECPGGLVYFEPFWPEDPAGRVHRAAGTLRGEGPWKLGEAVITVLGCHGTDPGLAADYEAWRQAAWQGEAVPDEGGLLRQARQCGVPDGARRGGC